MPGIRSDSQAIPLRYGILLAIAAFAFGAIAVRVVRMLMAKPATAQSAPQK